MPSYIDCSLCFGNWQNDARKAGSYSYNPKNLKTSFFPLHTSLSASYRSTFNRRP
ncbi:unnamed protein product [Larinioides sclopetarius]|uniref:Uncharacterized protein n=1 Tax=Larinioides sclopetarius TaxID=280406 RepID=A0AAV2B8T9_9ARAC